VQTHGGFGSASESHVGRSFRDARLMQLAPVSQELAFRLLATKVLGLPRSH
jgi:acyl-CoA dehydrogenase